MKKFSFRDCNPDYMLYFVDFTKSCDIALGQFTYESRDIRDKKLHPATFPIALSKKVIELFTHKGELVIDP
jgi:DNA modification methylase